MKIVLLALLLLLIPVCSGHVVTPEGLRKLNAILKKNKDDIEALLLRAHYSFNNNMFERALADMEHVQSVYTAHRQEPPPSVYLSLADLYFKLERFDDALEIYEKVLSPEFCGEFQDHTPVRDAIWSRAIIYSAKGKYQEAWKDAKLTMQILGSNLSVVSKAAEIAEKAGEREEAIKLYSNAILRFPNAGCENWLVRVLALTIEGNDYSQAQNLLDKLAAELPESPLPYYYRGLMAKYYFQDAGRFLPDMEQALKRSLQIVKEEDPVEGEFWHARVLLALCQPKQALEAVNRAIDEEPDHPALFRLRASIYRELGMNKQEEQDLQTREILAKQVGQDWLELFFIPIPEKQSEKSAEKK